MDETALPLVRPILLMASIFVIWLIVYRRRPVLRRALCPHRSNQAWMTNAVLFLASASIFYTSTLSILSTVSAGIRALLFADALLYANAPWLRWLFAGNLFWLLIAMLLAWYVLRPLRARATNLSWRLSRLEIVTLFMVTSAILSEIISQGQNIIMDILGPSLSSLAFDDPARLPLYFLLGNVTYLVILMVLIWIVRE